MHYLSKVLCVFVNSSALYGLHECLGSFRILYEPLRWYVIILCLAAGLWVTIYMISLGGGGGYVLLVSKSILIYLFL